MFHLLPVKIRVAVSPTSANVIVEKPFAFAGVTTESPPSEVIVMILICPLVPSASAPACEEPAVVVSICEIDAVTLTASVVVSTT